MEFVSTTTGEFYHKFKNKYNKLIVKVVSLRNYEEKKIILTPKSDEHIFVTIKLSKITTESLEEVVIEGRKKIRQKGDTLFYNIKEFTDGSEKKLKDILQKLPGIEVQEDGKIKFRGKIVSKLLLDGDDLFERDYNIATKHLNADIVKGIELYGNYNNNSVLMDFEKSGQLALNVLLKEDKINFSGDLSFFLGINSEKELKINTENTFIHINKKFKSFSVASYNNVGVNHSPRNFYTPGFSITDFYEWQDDKARYPIAESFILTPLRKNGIVLNNQQFYNINSLIPITKKTKFFFKIYYITDYIQNRDYNSSYFILNDTVINFEDESVFAKKPGYLKLDMRLEYKNGKKSYFQFITKNFIKKVNTQEFQNNFFSGNFLSNRLTNDFFSTQQLDYTFRSKKHNNITRVRLNHSVNAVSQNFRVHNIQSDTSFVQQVRHFKRLRTLQISRFYSKKKNNFKTLLGFTTKENIYFSQENFSQGEFAQRHYNFNKEIFLKLKNTYKLLRWQFQTFFKITYLNNQNSIEAEKTSKPFLYHLNVKIEWEPYKQNKIFWRIYKKRNYTEPELLFVNHIMIDYNSFIRQDIPIQINSEKGFSLRYKVSNLDGIFYFNTHLLFNEVSGSLIEKIDFVNKNHFISYNFLSEKKYSKAISFDVENFFYTLNTNVKLKLFWDQNDNFSFLNNNLIRRKINHFTIELSSGTFISKHFSFFHDFSWRQTKVERIDEKNNLIYYKSGLSGKINMFSFIVRNHLVGNIYLKKSFLWSTDVEIKLLSPVENFNFELIFKNLFQKKEIVEKFVFQNGYSVSKNSIQAPYVLFSVTYNF